MTALTSIALFIFAVIAYAIKELQVHGKLKWMTEGYGFWGSQSDKRKYKTVPDMNQIVKDFINDRRRLTFPPKINWYYRVFKILYKEKFPGSATIFVFVTDAPHALQLLFKLFLIGSIVMYKEMVNPLVDGLIYFAIWGIVFTIVYKEQSK